jgi:alpha-glucuronidase
MEGFGHKYFLSENFATPSQLGGVTAIQVSDSQTAAMAVFAPKGVRIPTSSDK